jgi:hypothetical protein
LPPVFRLTRSMNAHGKEFSWPNKIPILFIK